MASQLHAEYAVRTTTTIDEVSNKAMSEERYQETTVGRLIFSNDPGAEPRLPSLLQMTPKLPAPGSVVPKGEEGLCGACGVALRSGIGNPRCASCYKPGHRPIGTYESGAARWGVSNAGGSPRQSVGVGGGRHQLNLASEPSDLDGGGGHHVAGIDIDDSNRWKKQMRGRAKQGGVVEKAGLRGLKPKVPARVETEGMYDGNDPTAVAEGALAAYSGLASEKKHAGNAKRVWQLAERVVELEELNKKGEENKKLTPQERHRLKGVDNLKEQLGRATEVLHDRHRGWSAPRGVPYAPLGESPAMNGAGVWQSRPGPLKKNRYPVDILDDGRRQRDQGAANVQAQMLTATLTKSKTQKPVESAKSTPRQVPLPPPFDELKQQLAYGDMRLRAVRAGMDVASHIADGADFTPLSPRISGAPLTARELSRSGGIAAQSSGFPPSWSSTSDRFFSSRSMASTARIWGTTTAEMRTSATIRRKSRLDPSVQSTAFLFPTQPSPRQRQPLPPPGSPKNRKRNSSVKSSGAGAGGGSSAGAGALPGSKTAAPKVIGQLSVMRDLAVMAEHTFLEPSQQLQAKCTAFREKQEELDDRLQVALAQLEQHRSDNYRSKLKATLLMKDYKLTAKRPLKKELKFMGLMAQRDRTVRRLNAVRSAKWLTGMMVVVSSHPRPRNLNTPEQYVTDLLQMKVNEGVTMDAEALFEIFDMLEMDDLKAPRVLQIMEYARLKVGISFDDFNMYLEEAGVTSQDPVGDGGGGGASVNTREAIWLHGLEQTRIQREVREEAAAQHLSSNESPSSTPCPAPDNAGMNPGKELQSAVVSSPVRKERKKKQGPGHRDNPIDTLFEADLDLRDVFESPAIISH